ncbi:DUF6950 family protein [Vibrio fortis]|uniref:DUF6950 family protein n=1 Tax=Vibrio fortis TaxID=212667 RepID=UPI0038CD2EA2
MTTQESIIQEIQLLKLVNELTTKEFIVGETDCNLIALKVLQLQTDNNWYDLLYKRYKTYVGGARVAKKETGYSNIFDAFKELECLVAIPYELATVGDFIVHKEKGFTSCAIHLGNQVLVANHLTSKIEIIHIDYDELSADDTICYRVK